MSRTDKDKSWKYWSPLDGMRDRKVCRGCPWCYRGVYAKEYMRKDRHDAKRNILKGNWELI